MQRIKAKTIKNMFSIQESFCHRKCCVYAIEIGEQGKAGAYFSGRQQRGVPKGGAVIFLRREIYKHYVSSVWQGWTWKDKSCA